MVLIQRKLYFSKDPAGSNIFQGGSIFSNVGLNAQPNSNLFANHKT